MRRLAEVAEWLFKNRHLSFFIVFGRILQEPWFFAVEREVIHDPEYTVKVVEQMPFCHE